MQVILNGAPLEEVDCFKYLGSQVAVDEGCEREVVHRMNERYRAWGALKSMLSNRGLGIMAKKCLYEGVILPTALYGAKAWSMRSSERRKVNVLEVSDGWCQCGHGQQRNDGGGCASMRERSERVENPGSYITE